MHQALEGTGSALTSELTRHGGALARACAPSDVAAARVEASPSRVLVRRREVDFCRTSTMRCHSL